MTEKELVKLADRADPLGTCGNLGSMARIEPHLLQEFATLVAAAEREACAKILDANAEACVVGGMTLDVLLANAAAIRARGQA